MTDPHFIFKRIGFLIQLSIFTILLNVFKEFSAICTNIGLDAITLILADLTFLHEFIKLFLQLVFDSLNLGHLLLHLQEILLLVL